MKMNLYQILITGCDQAVALEIVCDVFCDFILIQIFISSVDQKLCIITLCELIVFCVNRVDCHSRYLQV